MYSQNGSPFRFTDRQYLITTDDEDDLNVPYSNGYTIREFKFNYPYNELSVKSADNKLMGNVDFPISRPSRICKSRCIPIMLLQDNNNLSVPEMDKVSTKSTQTCMIVQEQGVNTSFVSISIATQTITSNSSLTDQNNSGYNNEIEFISPSPNNVLVDSKLITFANTMAKVLQENKTETITATPSINEESVIFTYSLDNSQHSKSYYVDYSKSSYSSTSCEDLQSMSDSIEPHDDSSVKDTEPTNGSDIVIYLDQECKRYCYLPIDTTNQIPLTISWDYWKYFELRKFDEIIKSHENRFDRRLKAISNRMICRIEIIGPYNPCFTSYNSRNGIELYKLSIYSISSLRLEKSINCLQLSFPNSCFNEKIYKPKQNLMRY